VRLSRWKHYQLAARIGMSPSTFSRVINGLEAVRAGDPRIIRLAALLGIPSWQAFADGSRQPVVRLTDTIVERTDTPEELFARANEVEPKTT
jgi:hypothetical protein